METVIKCAFTDCVNYSPDGIPLFRDCYFCTRNEGEGEKVADRYQPHDYRDKIKESRQI